MQISSTDGSTDTGATAPFPPLIGLSTNPVPPGWAPDRDLRVAHALRIRIACIEDEITPLLDSHDRLADELHEVEARIRRSCWGGRA